MGTKNKHEHSQVERVAAGIDRYRERSRPWSAPHHVVDDEGLDKSAPPRTLATHSPHSSLSLRLAPRQIPFPLALFLSVPSRPSTTTAVPSSFACSGFFPGYGRLAGGLAAPRSHRPHHQHRLRSSLPLDRASPAPATTSTTATASPRTTTPTSPRPILSSPSAAAMTEFQEPDDTFDDCYYTEGVYYHVTETADDQE
ncbi:uncharacterized protein [Triticum aestivum]|uniref:uncharacterized protein n=1 Tax=Triticum aestivum TaxID=4565 RepID=UPI001D0178F6|nr:uncharacterized protein LOC123080734 [Triticum aestivum]